VVIADPGKWADCNSRGLDGQGRAKPIKFAKNWRIVHLIQVVLLFVYRKWCGPLVKDGLTDSSKEQVCLIFTEVALDLFEHSETGPSLHTVFLRSKVHLELL
jgi:hypothetical protein